MRLPGRGIALVVSYGHRRGEGLCSVPHLYDNDTAIDGSSCFAPVPHLGNNETTRARDRPGSKLWPSTGEGLRPVPHLYDNATTAIDGSSCFAPVPNLGKNETTRARDRPGSKLWPSTGEGLRPVPHLYDNDMAIDGSSCFASGWTKPPRGIYLWGASFVSMESHRLGECYSS